MRSQRFVRAGSCLLAQLGLAGGLAAQGPLFNYQSYPVDHGMHAFVADVNMDGRQDVISLTGSGLVEVLLGDGEGLLASAFEGEIADGWVVDAKVGDVNGDGAADIALVESINSEFLVYAGNASGAFSLLHRQTFVGTLEQVALADLDNDGDLDYAITNSVFPGSIEILLNDGSGVPNQASASVPTSIREPGPIVASDIDGDGDLDLVHGSSERRFLYIAWNEGDGLAYSISFRVPNFVQPTRLAAGDFNNDGAPDIAALDSRNYVLTIFLNIDGETLREDIQLQWGSEDGQSLHVADLNADGADDIMIASDGELPIYFLLNDGAGMFEAHPFRRIASVPALGDINADGREDLVTASSRGLQIVLADPRTGLASQPLTELPTTPSPRVLTGDVDGNGVADVIAHQTGLDRLYLLLADPFSPPALHEPWLGVMNIGGALGDLNGDGLLDIAYTRPTSGPEVDLGWAIGDGYGGFGEPTEVVIDGVPWGIQLIDFDLDGDLDIASVDLARDLLLLFENTGGAAFVALTPLPTRAGPRGLGKGDADQDGVDDLFLTDGFWVQVLRGNGESGFTALNAWALDVGAGDGAALGMAIADFNGDGYPDFASPTRRGVVVRFNNGSGDLPSSVALVTDEEFVDIAAGDFNLDGQADFAAVSPSADQLYVFLSRVGAPGFDRLRFFAGENPRGLAADDLNNDGAPDLIVTSSFGEGGKVVILYNLLGSACAADLAPHFGTLNFSDVHAFLAGFGAMDPLSDLAPSFGVFDMNDVLLFLETFEIGCQKDG